MSCRILVIDLAVPAALRGELKNASLRSVQRRFLQTIGVTRSAACQIERARYAALHLKRGDSIADASYKAGYFDQPHYDFRGVRPRPLPGTNEEQDMRKVINSTYVSLDGVVTNPQEWTFKFRDDAANQFAFEQLIACDALLMGRRTYEIFSEVWPTMKDEGGFADKMNSMPNHVASRTLKGTTWNATVIQGDLAEAGQAQAGAGQGHRAVRVRPGHRYADRARPAR